MSAFEQLAPFIQEFIYRNKWQELREVQVEACDIIFNTDNNMLIATPTASGKTEAAFLPVITEVFKKPPSSVGVLYIAPLKALINDQFVRVEKLLEEADIPITKWHGDAAQSAKNKLLNKPRGVLQITPESLEAMLMKRKQNVIALFSDLRYVVIDEVHSFIGTNRGVQLSSILERIQNLTENIPRRIGLSATLGDIDVAEEWLNNATKRKCRTITVTKNDRKIQLMLHHFYANPLKLDDESWIPYYDFLYNLTYGKKSIIFSNTRSNVEMNINRLKLIAERKKDIDVFHAHHGNISAESREYTEEQMRTSHLPLVTGATVTLELGIDLGSLERIVQTGAPFSVASLSQRLGRSGRRNGISQMCFVLSEESPKKSESFYKSINWEFIRCIALIELYRERWTEPLRVKRFPYSILFHQTMSVLYGNGDTAPAVLAQKMLSEQTFKNISQDDYKILLQYMIKTEMIEKTQEGKLTIGKVGEELTNSYEFFTVFETPVEYSVREGTKEIGSLYQLLPVGERFILSGKAWKISDIDKSKRVIYVEYVGGKSTVAWKNPISIETHIKVSKKMREVIVSENEYGYLSEEAAQRLMDMRDTVRKTGLFPTEYQADIFPISPNRYGLIPWIGTRAQNALIYSLMMKGIKVDTDYFENIIFIKDIGIERITKTLKKIKTSSISIDDLPLPDDTHLIGKYSDYVHPLLAKKQFAEDFIDIEEMQKELKV